MRSLPFFCLLVLGSGGFHLLAQIPHQPTIGRSPTPSEMKFWSVPIAPTGRGLPAGRGNALQGRTVFLRKCAGCHGDLGEGHDPVGPQLVGGIGSLATTHPVLTVGSYWPYSTSVWDYIHRAMPYYPDPGTLTADETYAVTAYILELNGLIGRMEEMNGITLPKVKMPNRDGFVDDPRPDVHPRPKTFRRDTKEKN